MLALLAFLAMAADAEHTTSIDLFEADVSPDKPDWKTDTSGLWTKEYIGWTIDAQQGDGTVKFGDVRFHDEVLIGDPRKDNGDYVSYVQEPFKVMMAIRVNGVDDYYWPFLEEEPGLWLASKPKDPNWMSDDPSTRVWKDEPGFYIWDHNITDLTIKGLPYSSETQVEVIWFAVAGIHDSMASHGLTHCVNTDIDLIMKGAFFCGGTDLQLKVVGWQIAQPFPSAPKVAKTLPREASPLDDPSSIFNPGIKRPTR